MDPLSVTASIITVLTTAGALLKALEQIRSRSNPNEELLLLMNSVTDLQMTLITARNCANILETNQAPGAQRSHQEIHESICRLQVSLDRLVDFARAKLVRTGKGLPFLPFFGKKKKLSELRESISEAHRNLQTVLLSANLRYTPPLLSAIEEVAIIENDHYANISAKLEHVMEQATSMQSIHRKRPPNNDFIVEKHGLQNPAVLISIVQQAATGADTSVMSQQVRMKTSIPLKRCGPSCICQCHIRTHYQTPRWLSAAVGTLFYCSANTPSVEVRPCNSKRCYRSQASSSVHLTYHFPAWMMRTALVYSTWNNLDGTNSSWTIRMPRVVPETQSCWLHIWNGHEDHIKQLLQRREMSPWDVYPSGDSSLQIAVTYEKLGICSLLLAAGADWQYKDRHGWCPADSAWRRILMSESTDPQVIKLRELLGSEECYDLQLSAIHRIVVGLSNADIQEQLALDPTLINQADWIDMSPLMWAALRADAAAVQCLLSHSANVHLKSREQKTALHYAARSGSHECVKLLLDAGADANVCDKEGETPLHDAVYLVLPQLNVEAVVSTLKDYGADLNCRDRWGNSPIIMAIYKHNPGGIEALVKAGCNPNIVSDNVFPTALPWAVFFNKHDCVETLIRSGACFSWTTASQKKENILEYAATYATVEMMETLVTSDTPAVRFDRRQIMASFEARNAVRIYLSVGQSVVPPREIDLAALENLLEKKGIEIDTTTTQRLVELDDSTDASDKSYDSDDGEKYDDADDFEDAIEHFAHAEKVG